MYVCVHFVSDSLQPHGLRPTRLLRPWDFPGKNTLRRTYQRKGLLISRQKRNKNVCFYCATQLVHHSTKDHELHRMATNTVWREKAVLRMTHSRAVGTMERTTTLKTGH